MGTQPKTPSISLVTLEPARETTSEPEEPATKMARLRHLVATGRYEVDLGLLAARILEDDPHGDDS